MCRTILLLLLMLLVAVIVPNYFSYSSPDPSLYRYLSSVIDDYDQPSSTPTPTPTLNPTPPPMLMPTADSDLERSRAADSREAVREEEED